eukprot:102796_1
MMYTSSPPYLTPSQHTHTHTHTHTQLSNTGTWDEHIQRKINTAYGVLNTHRKILTSNYISFKTRLKIAHSKIISHLRYGEEIFVLNAELIKKIQRCENNII